MKMQTKISKLLIYICTMYCEFLIFFTLLYTGISTALL